MKYTLLFILLLPSVLSFSQEENNRDAYFGLSLNQTLSPAPKITKLYLGTEGADIKGLWSIGFEARLSYGIRMSDRISIGSDIAMGTNSIQLELKLDEGFTDSKNWPLQFFYSVYAGYDFTGRYSLWLNRKNDFGVSAGFRWIYFFPVEESYRSNIFFMSVNSNGKERSFLAPELGLFYQRKLSERWSIGLRADVSYSKRLVLENSELEPYFDIIGKEIILHGTLEQNYQQVNMGLEVHYLFAL